MICTHWSSLAESNLAHVDLELLMFLCVSLGLWKMMNRLRRMRLLLNAQIPLLQAAPLLHGKGASHLAELHHIRVMQEIAAARLERLVVQQRLIRAAQVFDLKARLYAPNARMMM